MSNLLVLPILIPLTTAALCMAIRRRPVVQASVSIAGAAGLLAVAIVLLVRVNQHGMHVLQVGGWEAPIGITLLADPFATIMLALVGVMALAATIYLAADGGPGGITPPRQPAMMPLLHVLLTGVSGAFLTGDLFNLYVWFEVLLIASFGLVALGARRDHVEGTVKAMVLNLIGSAMFLIAAGVTYGMVGTLNMADLHVRLTELAAIRPHAVTAVGFTLLLAFALKAAIFPLYFWLPASYHVPSAGVCAIFAALLTKVGIYAMVRVFTLPFASVDAVFMIVLVLATITMVSGTLGAVAQYEIKRILAWHSVGQVGYIAVGFGLLGSPNEEARLLGLTALIVFIVHHGLVKPTLFLIGGLVEQTSGTSQLKPNGGMLKARPVLGVMFLLAALSLAGLPPFSGFWAKLSVVQATVHAEAWWALGVALGAGLLTLLSMLKIWIEVFWKPRPAGAGTESRAAMRHRSLAGRLCLWSPTVALMLLITAIGLWPAPLLTVADRAAAVVLEPGQYLRAVGLEPAGELTQLDAGVHVHPGADPLEGGMQR